MKDVQSYIFCFLPLLYSFSCGLLDFQFGLVFSIPLPCFQYFYYLNFKLHLPCSPAVTHFLTFIDNVLRLSQGYSLCVVPSDKWMTHTGTNTINALTIRTPTFWCLLHSK